MTAQVIPYKQSRSRSVDRGRIRSVGPRLIALTLFIVAAIAVFFSMIFLRISLDETAFELDRIATEVSVEQSRQLDLRYDLAVLQDPLRIATEAERIGLVFPQERIAIVMDAFVTDAQVLEIDVPVSAMTGDR